MSQPKPTQGELNVKGFLTKLNLAQYIDRFVNEGFDQLPSIYEVTEQDLAVMDVKRGHRRLIQREIATMKGIPQSSPLVIGAHHRDDMGALPPPISFDIPTPSKASMSSKVSLSPRQGRLNDRTMTAFFSSPYFPYTAESGAVGSRVGGSISSSSGQHSSMSTSHGVSMTSSGGTSISTRNSSISSTEDDNGVSDTSNHPSKRKYRRHAKPDKNAPIKPPSAYVMFSNKVRAELKNKNMSFAELAKTVGDRWQSISPQEKDDYEMTAARAKEDYLDALSNYEQTQDYMTYQNYKSDFKAKQEAAGRVSGKIRKRMKIDSPGSGNIANSSGNGQSPSVSHSFKVHNSSHDYGASHSASTSAFSAFDPSSKPSSPSYGHQQSYPSHHPTRSHLPPHHTPAFHHNSSSQSYLSPHQYYDPSAHSASNSSSSSSSDSSSASNSSFNQMQSSDSGGHQYSHSPPSRSQSSGDSPPLQPPLGEGPPLNPSEDAQ